MLAEPAELDRVDVDAVAFSPRGRLAAAVGDVIRYREEGLEEIVDFGFLWEVETGRLVRRLERVRTHATAVPFTPDEKRLVTGRAGSDVESCLLRVWDVTTGRVLRELRGHDAPIRSLDVSPDGRWAASIDHRGSLRVWSLAEGREIANHLEPDDRRGTRRRTYVAFLTDGRSFLTAGTEGVKLWTLTAEASLEAPAKSDSAAQAAPELDELVKLAEESLQRVRTQYELGGAGLHGVLDARIDLLEAKLRRARRLGAARPTTDLLEELVGVNEERVRILEEEVKSGIVSESKLREAHKQLIEARLRLKEN